MATRSTFSTDVPTDISTSSPPTRKGVDKKTTIALSTAAVLLGGSAFFWGTNGTGPNNGPEEPTPPTPIPVKNPTDEVPLAHNVHREMTFEQAFEAAREEVGPGGLFAWHGHVYNTYEREEWQSLSLTQRQEFLHDVGYEPAVDQQSTTSDTTPDIEPIYIETSVNGQRVVGIDIDNDGIIDNVVMQSQDGLTYSFLDAEGNQALDTVWAYDPVTQETRFVYRLEEPEIITNAGFEQFADHNRREEFVQLLTNPDSAPNADTDPVAPVVEAADSTQPTAEHESADNASSKEGTNDTSDQNESDFQPDDLNHDEDYVNNGSVSDID